MPIRPESADEIIAQVKKKLGVDAIHRGDMIPPVFRIPFDSLEMNLATYGGAPMGRMTRLWGGPMSTKSLCCWGLVKQAQQHRSERFPDGCRCAYYNVEGVYDPQFVAARGVDTSKIHILDFGVIEDIGRAMDVMLDVAHIHIIDSVSMATSREEYEAPKDGSRPGNAARAWGRVLRDVEERMDKQENMIVLVDQVRVDFRTGADKVAGGRLIGHATSLQLHYRQAKKLFRLPDGSLGDTRPKVGNDPLTGTHRVDGYEVEIECDKSRVCRPFGKARLRFDLDSLEFDRLFELKKAGIFLGVIKQSGSYYSASTVKKSMQGEKALYERLSQDEALVMSIYSEANQYMVRGNL